MFYNLPNELKLLIFSFTDFETCVINNAPLDLCITMYKKEKDTYTKFIKLQNLKVIRFIHKHNLIEMDKSLLLDVVRYGNVRMLQWFLNNVEYRGLIELAIKHCILYGENEMLILFKYINYL
jgi:hypothetical protein